ncbi:hypothetical protein NL676_020005 [Syzygium grande]|nr:hypothetical protein NL676_020005 [Syzygium grande]
MDTMCPGSLEPSFSWTLLLELKVPFHGHCSRSLKCPSVDIVCPGNLEPPFHGHCFRSLKSPSTDTVCLGSLESPFHGHYFRSLKSPSMDTASAA